MRSFSFFPDHFYCVGACLGSLRLWLIVLALAGEGSAFGQVGCTYRAGTIQFVATGGSTNPAYTTQYLLTDAQGLILALSSVPSFTGVSAGTYQVYALNYDPGKLLQGNRIGAPVGQINGACFDVSAPFPLNVCPREGTSCDYPVGTISFIASGGNTSSGYQTRYVLTDSTGQIRSVSATPTFSVSAVGSYLAYGVNYKDDGTLIGLTVGASLSGVSAGCLDKGIPLILEICAPQLVSVLPQVYLQGALFNVPLPGLLMRDDLRQKGLVPLNSPYPGLGFTELTASSATTSGVLSVTGSNAIVDWVLVELRNPSSSSIVVDSRAGLLQRDGDIVGTDGVSTLRFSQASVGNYYVSVRHRNHLGVMSGNSLPLSTTGTVVDFRNPSTSTFTFDATNPINQAQVVVNQGVALWAGNTQIDNQVIYQGTGNDVNPISSQVLNAPGNFFIRANYVLGGYYSGDVNLNGEVIFQGTTNDVDFIYQNVIKNHPGNTLKANNFIIREQLPL